MAWIDLWRCRLLAVDCPLTTVGCADIPKTSIRNSEDHAADMVRYACMGRPWLKPAPPKPEEPKSGYALYDGAELGDARYVHNSVKLS